MAESAGPAHSYRRRQMRTTKMKRRDAGWDKATQCGKCEEGWLQRVHRETFLEFVLSCFGFYPFICSNCFVRKYRLRPRQLLSAAGFTVLAASLLLFGTTYVRRQYKLRQERVDSQAYRLDDTLPPAPASPPARGTASTGSADDGASAGTLLNNQDVVRMVQSGMSTSVICSVVGRGENRFQVDDAGVEGLRNAGVPERVIDAMREAARGNH